MNLLNRRSTIDKDILPLSVLRNSLLVIFIIGLMLASFFFFVKLKNAIQVPAEIRSSQDAFDVFSKKKGIFTFTVKNGDNILTNETIGYHEQNGDIASILQTNAFIQNLKKEQLLETPYKVYDNINVATLIPKNLKSSFNELKKEIISYLTLVTIEKEFLSKKIRVLNKQQHLESGKIIFFDLQDSLSSIQKKLIVKQNRRDSLLFVENILSADEVEVNRLDLINERKNAIRNYIDRFSSEGTVSSIKLEELNMVKEYSTAIYTQTSRLENALHNLKNSLRLWENENLVKAPIDGVVLLKTTEIRVPFEENEVLLSISPKPTEKQEFTIYLDIPTAYISYVKSSQSVQIKVNEYPFLKYGMVEGEIIEIPTETANDYYRCKARLTEGMQTSYGQVMQPKNKYLGIAQVTLKRENLVEKIKNILIWRYHQK